MGDGFPDHFGDYHILEMLGEGGMGRVYRARQERLGREVALKVLHRRHADRDDFAKRFLREARAAAALSHPNVITCHDVGSIDGVLYMALELVTGGDAAKLAASRGGMLPEREALGILRDCACGLAAIEEAGLIHRDLKPANIFLTQRGSAKIADLGLARPVDVDREQLTLVGAPMGTPAYMPPEQAQGAADLDIRADIFALGATLWCLLIGRPPFLADSPMATLARLLNEPLPDPLSARPDLRPTTVALLRATLDKDRNRRPRHASDLVVLVQGALDGLASLLPSTGSPTPAGGVAALPPTGASAAGRTPTPTPRASANASERATTQRKAAAAAANIDVTPLVKRLHIAPDRMEAWINLAPDTCFPLELLQRVLIAAGVSHGVVQPALVQASRRTQAPRRLVVAEGIRPLPDSSGTDVFGHEVPPCPEPVVVLVADDAMEAWALFRPGTICREDQVEAAVRKANLRFGFDREALRRLWHGPPDPSGRLVIARGTAMQPGRAAGFVLAVEATGSGAAHMSRVAKGQELARWQEGDPGRKGMDVFGRIIPTPVFPAPDLGRMVGEGTKVQRDRSGMQVLVAARDGVAQQQLDGRIRVISAVEISGDVGPGSPPVQTDDVVVVRGSVLPGAKICSTNDVVILGDLHDACIEAGGSIEVRGDVNPGGTAVMAGGTVAVTGTVARTVVAGNLKITGTVRHCALVATGDIEVTRVVGGSLSAGGSITVETAGDEHGATTELSAGKAAGSEEREQVARLAEVRLAAEVQKVGEEYRAQGGEFARTRAKATLLEKSAYRDPAFFARAQEELGRQASELERIDTIAGEARERLAAQRKIIAAIRRQGVNLDARIEVTVVAHRGVVACLADAEPVVLHLDRPNFVLSLK